MIQMLIGTTLFERGMRLRNPVAKVIFSGTGAMMTIHGADRLRETVSRHFRRP